MIMKRKKQQVITYLLIAALLTTAFLPGFTVQVEAAPDYIDPLMEELLPQPGSMDFPSPFLPNTSSNLAGIPRNYPVWDDFIPNQDKADNPLPDDPVRLPNGEAVITGSDISLPSFGFQVNLTRQYNTANKDKLSPFGYGWDFSYDYF